jgi:hypothetical protein
MESKDDVAGPTARFADILGDFPKESQAEIEALVPARYKTSKQLRTVVLGMKRMEATAFLLRNIPGITELDASALAGVLLSRSEGALNIVSLISCNHAYLSIYSFRNRDGIT